MIRFELYEIDSFIDRRAFVRHNFSERLIYFPETIIRLQKYMNDYLKDGRVSTLKE